MVLLQRFLILTFLLVGLLAVLAVGQTPVVIAALAAYL
jgi:hypothetical protein